VTIRSDLRRGVLSLTLDTPGSSVNVLTRDAASSLRELVVGVDPTAIRAVVLRSAKPASFVNGVSLMLAGTVKSVEEAARLTAPVREAYRALRSCPVPTVSAIRGNCYGCGVELTLECRYRLASDDRDTHFYMTELADYLLIPTFGATQHLPRMLGLENAIDLLLWGQRWSARHAFEQGLVDGCFKPDAFDREVDAFVDAVAPPGGRSSHPPRPAARRSGLDEIRTRTNDRIRRLPPAYRELYATCFDLMTAAVTSDGEDGYEREALASARSALTPQSRAATPFFFMRQAARSLALAGCPDAMRTSVAFSASDPGLRALCEELGSSDGEEAARSSLRLVPYTTGAAAHSLGGRIAVSDRVGNRFDGRQGVVMHAPLRPLGIAVAEVACDSGAVPEEQALSAALADRYFTVVRTRPRGLFVLDDLLRAWLTPQIAYLGAGGTPADLAASLRAFGFMRLPGDWLDGLDSADLCELVLHGKSEGVEPLDALLALPRSTCEGGAENPAIMGGLLASLGGFVARALRDRLIPHVTFADIMARDVLDFPLQHTSVCRYLTLTRCRELLDNQTAFRRLVLAENMSSFETFAVEGRAFYQGHAHR
jgi:enoyl-CoA hydratase/carnithine racemase